MLTNSLEAAVAERAALDPPPDAVIEVRGLRKAYGDREAVRGVDLTVRRGEIFAFLGPNGAGKTTTVEVLEGLLRADGGTVRVPGEDPASAPLRWRERVGIVQQESVTEPELTVRECLELYAGFYRAPRDVDATLALCGLGDHGARRSGMLSGGEKRRLDVALALVGDPDLVFLDEPTTGFDPAARRASWEVIDGLRALGKTIFLTTHYLEEAERLADRIAVIVGGRIVAEGTPATLGARDRAAGTIGFTLPAGAALPPGVAERAQVAKGRVALRSARPMADLHALSGWALDHGLELHDIEVRRPTLEDVYLELVSTHTDDRG
ncbi:MAG TPA: ABC transporter ATP-binding protein [Solirubrobacteraceae bacterium]|nr:ABC transporter ATP-binding protein [Solirubrobacteraceae bacterium]